MNFKCFDTFNKNWVGTALELVIMLLLRFYERMGDSEFHSLLDPKLKHLGFSSLQSSKYGLLTQIIFIEGRN